MTVPNRWSRLLRVSGWTLSMNRQHWLLRAQCDVSCRVRDPTLSGLHNSLKEEVEMPAEIARGSSDNSPTDVEVVEVSMRLIGRTTPQLSTGDLRLAFTRNYRCSDACAKLNSYQSQADVRLGSHSMLNVHHHCVYGNTSFFHRVEDYVILWNRHTINVNQDGDNGHTMPVHCG